MYSTILYESVTNPYIRLVRIEDGGIWDTVAEALNTTATWANTDIPLTLNAYIGGYPVTIPPALPPGEYDLLLYDASSPANSDTIELQRRIRWSGERIYGLPETI